MADKGSIAMGLVERLAFNILKRLNIDSTGRLRVGDITLAASQTLATVTGVTTVATVTNLTNWGVTTAQGKSQWESQAHFQASYRRNFVQT